MGFEFRIFENVLQTGRRWLLLEGKVAAAETVVVTCRPLCSLPVVFFKFGS